MTKNIRPSVVLSVVLTIILIATVRVTPAPGVTCRVSPSDSDVVPLRIDAAAIARNPGEFTVHRVQPGAIDGGADAGATVVQVVDNLGQSATCRAGPGSRIEVVLYPRGTRAVHVASSAPVPVQLDSYGIIIATADLKLQDTAVTLRW